MPMREERLEELGRRIADHHDARLDELQDRLETRFDMGEMDTSPRAYPAGRRAVVRKLAIAALVCIALIAALWAWRSLDAPEEAAGGAGVRPVASGKWFEPESSPERLEFADGSVVLASPRARLQATRVRPNGATMTLERGSIDVDVRHHDETQWTFVAGPYRVDVTGTSFVLDWSPDARTLTVDMREGSVVVRGPGGLERTLTGGESAVLRPDPEREPAPVFPPEQPSSPDGPGDPPPIEDAALETPSPEPEAQPERPRPSVRRPKTRRPAEPEPAGEGTWREVARRGDYERALKMAKALGLEELRDALPPGELYELADAARFAGSADEAKRTYEAVRARFPSHDLAARAAFDLGVLSKGRQQVDWFEAYLRERPGGPLAREALGRLLELHAKAGDLVRGRDRARVYLERYPRGPHASIAQRLLEERD